MLGIAKPVADPSLKVRVRNLPSILIPQALMLEEASVPVGAKSIGVITTYLGLLRIPRTESGRGIRTVAVNSTSVSE